MLRALLSRLCATFERRRLETEFDEEAQAHLDMLTERFASQGRTPEEAYYAARRQFGGITQMKQELRERRAFTGFDAVCQDVRHALRQMRKAKSFTASAALILALGIGASTAVFAVLDTVVLRPLPYAAPERLMAFRSIDRRGVPHPSSLSYPNFFDFRKQNKVFEHLVCYRDARFTLTDSLPPIRVAGEIVSWDLFAMLSVQPKLGRGFLAEEEKAGTHAVILSDGLWRSRFGGDRGIVGRTARINGRPFTVVGVAPAGFQFPLDTPDVQLWATLSEDAAAGEFTPLTAQRGARVLDAMGRLKPGITADQAQAQMNTVGEALARQYPAENKNIAAALVRPELERLTGSSRKPLWTLLGAVGLVLLIACANVANLLLTRSTERAREFALRTALGASRRALLRQLFVESLALGLLGAAGGVLLAAGVLREVLPLAGDSIPRIAQAGIDVRVLAFSICAAVFTSVLFSLAPAVQTARADLAGTLKQGALNIARGRHRLRSALVIGQITLGLALLAGAEMLIASFVHLTKRDAGFQADHLLAFDVGLSDTDYNVARQIAFCDRLIERLRAIPGVRAASTGVPLPLEGEQMSVSFDIEERPAAPPDRPHSDMAIVTPGYFATMGIRLRKGRDFTERDTAKSPPVLVVNEAFARKYFPGEDVIGKRIKPGATNGDGRTTMHEIVGVVANAKQAALSMEAEPIYYFPYKQLSWGFGSIVLRTAVPPLEVEAAARAAVASLDAQAPMYKVRTGEEMSAIAIARPRFQVVLMGSFAGIALVLTVMGLYGVLSYAVAKQRREIGVRIALGAGRREVLGLVLRDASRLVAVGVTLGLAGAAGAAQLLESMVYGMRSNDPLLIAGACCAIVVTSAAAAYVPARRAAAVEPMQALRSE